MNGIDISEMRDATKEEQESVDNYIKSISSNVGAVPYDLGIEWDKAYLLRRFNDALEQERR